MPAVRKIKSKLNAQKLAQLKAANKEAAAIDPQVEQQYKDQLLEQLNVIRDELLRGIIEGIQVETKQSAPIFQRAIQRNSEVLNQLVVGIKEGMDNEIKELIDNVDSTTQKSIEELSQTLVDGLRPLEQLVETLSQRQPSEEGPPQPSAIEPAAVQPAAQPPQIPTAEQPQPAVQPSQAPTAEQPQPAAQPPQAPQPPARRQAAQTLKQRTAGEKAQDILAGRERALLTPPPLTGKQVAGRILVGGLATAVGLGELAEKKFEREDQKRLFVEQQQKLGASPEQAAQEFEQRDKLKKQLQEVEDRRADLKASGDYTPEQIERLTGGERERLVTALEPNKTKQQDVVVPPTLTQQGKQAPSGRPTPQPVAAPAIPRRVEGSNLASALATPAAPSEEVAAEAAVAQEKQLNEVEQQVVLLTAIKESLDQLNKHQEKLIEAVKGGGAGGGGAGEEGGSPDISDLVGKGAGMLGKGALAAKGAAVAAAGVAGYAAGKYIVNPLLDMGAEALTGQKGETFGTGLYAGVEKLKGALGFETEEQKFASADEKNKIDLGKKKIAAGQPISRDMANTLQKAGVDISTAQIVEPSQSKPALAAAQNAAPTPGDVVQGTPTVAAPAGAPTALAKTPEGTFSPEDRRTAATEQKAAQVEQAASKLGVKNPSGQFERGVLTKIVDNDTGKVYDVSSLNQSTPSGRPVVPPSIAEQGAAPSRSTPPALSQPVTDQTTVQAAAAAARESVPQAQMQPIVMPPAPQAQIIPAPFATKIRNQENTITTYIKSRYVTAC